MSELSLAYIMPALPEIFLALASMALLICGVLMGNRQTFTLGWLTVITLAVAGLLVLGLDWTRTVTFNGLFVIDGFTAYVKMFVILGLIASLAMSIRYLYQEQMARFEYPVLVMLAGLGMMIMISSNHMLTLYLGLELQSLALYVLAAIRRNHARAAEAGIKYFILGALASGMLLFGMSLVYGFGGALGFEAIAAHLDGLESVPAGLVVGLVFILVGMAFKISAVPFHMWTPDVYQGAPTSVTALFAIVPKLAGMAILIRLLFEPFGALTADWQQIIWVLAAGSMIVGAFAGLVQGNIKRLLAYSSIGNMGYALIGVVAATQSAIGATLVYMIIYMVMTAGAFAALLMLRRDGRGISDIADFSGLSKTNPVLAYALAAIMFSMSGIPPLAGFFGKFLIFQAAVASGFYVLAVIGVLTSVVAAYYYLKIIKVMFFDEPQESCDKIAAFSKRIVLLCAILFIMLFIFWPDVLIETSVAAASSLFVAG